MYLRYALTAALILGYSALALAKGSGSLADLSLPKTISAHSDGEVRLAQH
jgi:hypothetical protein